MTTEARSPGPAPRDLVMGRYRLEERLGSGGSADVWAGYDERLRRPVAIKLLHPHLLRDATARRRFEREARAAAGLSHPGIVTVYDIDASPKRPAIVLELVVGETLAGRLRREGALPAGEAARIGAELAEALEHAHERGVVHRDVKPGNVLLDDAGRARLTDFGIARVLEGEAAALTTADLVPGTLRYLAPEQLAGAEASPAADLYALGVVLYEMVAGRPPFEAASPVALARAQGQAPPPVPGAPVSLEAVWHDALQPDPARRPPGAGVMAARLRAQAAPPTEAAPSPGVRQREASAVADDPTVTVAAPDEARWPLAVRRRRGRRPPWAAVAAAAGPVAGIAVAAIVLASLVGGIGPREEATSPGAAISPRPTPVVEATVSPEPTAEPSAGEDGKGKGRGKGRGG